MSEIEPKNDDLWFFIARAAYLGVASYAVVFCIAILRDLFRRLPRRARRNLRSGPMHYVRRIFTPPPDTRIFVYVELLRLASNLVICVIYVFGTYRRSVLVYMTTVNRVFVSFYIFDLFHHLVVAQSAISHVTRVAAILDAFTYPSLVLASGPSAYLNFSFLRSVVAYDAFSMLEKRLFIRLFGPRRLIFKLIFQFIALFYTLAAAIQLLEIPGDLLPVDFRQVWSDFEDWNFVNSCYFIIVTLSTVGYGDFSPATVQGRVFTLFIIIVGIVVFTTVISQLVEQASRGRGSGWFAKNSHTRHVIVSGTPTMTDLVHFISEFYSDSRRSNTDARIAVMVEEPLWTDTQWFQHIARNQFLQSRLQFLVGSARNTMDLHRARITSADAVFILTSPSTGEDPSLQDSRTIINVLAIRNVRTDIPIYAQTLLEDSNLQTTIALSTASSCSKDETFFRTTHMAKNSEYAGVFYKVLQKEYDDLPQAHREEGRHCFEDVLNYHQRSVESVNIHDMNSNLYRDLERSEHVCLQEIHMALISGNLKANGVGTLLSNMYLDVRTAKLSKEDPSWLAEYHMGAACSLKYAIIPKALHDVKIKVIASDLFHLGALAIATSDSKQIRPRPILGTDVALRRGDLLLLLTYHDFQYVCGALHLVAQRYKRDELRHHRPVTESRNIPESLIGRNTRNANVDPFMDPEDNHGREWRRRLSRAHRGVAVSSAVAAKFSKVSGDDLDALADAAAANSGHFQGLLSSGTSDALLEKRSDGYMPDNLSGHIILAMEGDAPLRNLPLLLRNLWRRGTRRSTQIGQKVRVVVVHPSIDDRFRERFARFEKVSLFFVEGSPSSRATWKKARLNTARSVATLADYTKPWAQSDARTIFSLLTLDVCTNIDHDLFICSELVDEKSLEFLREPTHPRRRGASLGEDVFQNETSEEILENDPFRESSNNVTHQEDQARQEGTPESETVRQGPKGEVDFGQSQVNNERKSKGSHILGLPRIHSGGGSVKSAEIKAFIKTAVAGPEGINAESGELGADPATRPGAARARRGTLFSRSRYASGELLVQSSAITLMAREYIEPGFVNFFTSLLGKDSRRPGMKIRLVRIPETMFDTKRGFSCKRGRKLVRYNDVFNVLVEAGVTPLGMYRSGIAPVLIPAKFRRRRGPAVLEELAPLLQSRDADGRKQRHGESGGIFTRISGVAINLFKALMPQNMREALGREEIDGKSDDSSSEDFSEDEENDHNRRTSMPVRSNGEVKQSPQTPQDDGKTGSPHSSKEDENGNLEKDNRWQKLKQTSSLPSWLTPKANASTSQFFFDDDASLEVPGQVKYTERSVTQNLLPYVFTLPDPGTWCAETDGIYILCDPSFELPSKWSETTADVDEPENTDNE